MKSMTGFGRATAAFERQEFAVQVSSVNRKNLEVSVSAPNEWDALEPIMIEKVRAVVTRGTIKVKIEVNTNSGAAILPELDDAAVTQTLNQLAQLATKQGLAFQPTAELLWEIASTQRKGRLFPALEAVQPALLGALDKALNDFSAMRILEGAALQADLLARVKILAKLVEDISAQAPKVPAAYRENLLKRLREARLELDVNDERVLKEIALFADRCDITEELTRLRSHLEQFDALLRSEGEIGRKADFIVQEIGREINTLGSKANDLTISRAVIEAKNELERFREQLANVE